MIVEITKIVRCGKASQLLRTTRLPGGRLAFRLPFRCFQALTNLFSSSHDLAFKLPPATHATDYLSLWSSCRQSETNAAEPRLMPR